MTKPRRGDDAGGRAAGSVAGRRRLAADADSPSTDETVGRTRGTARLRAMSASTKWIMGIVSSVLAAVIIFLVQGLIQQGPARISGGPSVEVEFVTVDQDNNPADTALAAPPTGQQESDILFGGSAVGPTLLDLEKQHGGGPVETMSIQIGLIGEGRARFGSGTYDPRSSRSRRLRRERCSWTPARARHR